ncbi:acyl-CoA dehydrogenase family protein [Streptomyces sp. NPDC059165]|uniref:acyl-CoA dehydrogenase family protein n=1 Tax=Streptomyces sp. NPDC059165 TaxID=3346751 RepID=UPI0036CD7840
MRFRLTDEQAAFSRSLDAMLTAEDTVAAVRAWATGDPGPGRAVWSRLGAAGMFALAVPEAYDGVGPLPVELAVAFVELGRHAVPGPLVETTAAAVLLAHLGDDGPAKRLLPGIASGDLSVSLRLPGRGRYALDADTAGYVLVVEAEDADAPGRGAADADRPPVPPRGAASEGDDGRSREDDDSPRWRLRAASGHGGVRASSDPARRLAVPNRDGEVLAAGPEVRDAAHRAGDWARLATAAQSLGVGLTLLDRTVSYVRQRKQFGMPIGAFQAVKHQLADALVALEFARPLVFGAALSMASSDIAAAKVAAGEGAYNAARTALQLHGAIGYTDEFDLSLWLRKARPLRDAWGAPAQCRSAVLAD